MITTTSTYRPRLLRMAALTTPIIGLYNITPVLLVFSALPLQDEFFEFFSLPRFLGGLSMITFTVFMMWLGNIWFHERFAVLVVRSRFWKGWHRYVLAYLLGFGLIFIFTSITMEVRPPTFATMRLYPFVGSMANTTVILILINLVVAQDQKAQLELDKAQLEIANLLAQQEQLKQQVHPHFLFNALATLQILIKKDSEQALQYASLLSRFLRESLDMAQHDLCTIAEEIRFFEHYIGLQQIRFAQAIRYDLQIPDDVQNTMRLPVFSLQLLAENAIKHNALSAERPLSITVRYEPSGHLLVQNNKLPKFSQVASPGIGLDNLKNRYSHFSSDPPQITDEETRFCVRLRVL